MGMHQAVRRRCGTVNPAAGTTSMSGFGGGQAGAIATAT